MPPTSRDPRRPQTREDAAAIHAPASMPPEETEPEDLGARIAATAMRLAEVAREQPDASPALLRALDAALVAVTEALNQARDDAARERVVAWLIPQLRDQAVAERERAERAEAALAQHLAGLA